MNPTALVQGDICRGYGAALASSALAISVAWVLGSLLEPTPFLPFLAAVTYSAYRGGLGPALVTTALGAFAATYLFLSPATFAIDSAVTAFRLTGYLFVALLISLAIARLYGARQQAERELNQMKSARADAEAALRVRDDFLALASHDLKNPLTAIRGHAQLLQRQAAQTGTTDGEVIAQRAVGIVTATNRMATVLNELLDLARLQLGQPLDLHRRPTDLVALTRRVAAEYHLVTERHQIRVEAAVPDLIGEWDSFRLERVLANLLSNAIKYSPRGGDIVVTLTQEETPTRAFAVLSVRDQGMGIPAADLPHVFERFYRAGNVASEQISGSGIGLAGCCQIIEQHGGQIQADSIEGTGSTFMVRLPLDRTPEPALTH